MFSLYTSKSLKEFGVLLCLSIHISDEDLVDVKIRGRNMSDN
jgi:hypothetical protein